MRNRRCWRANRIGWSWLGLVGLVLCSCLPSKTDIRRGKSLYRLGVSQSNRGMYRQALAVLVQAEQANPYDYWIQEALGGTLMRMNRPQVALRHFQRALKLSPKSPRGWNNLGTAYMQLQKWSKAAHAFHKALDNILYQTPCMAEMNLGWSYYKLKKKASAIKYLRRAIKHCPRLCQGYRLLGKASRGFGDKDAALTSFHHLTQLCKKYPEGFFLLAQMQVEKRLYTKAVHSSQRCIKLAQTSPKLLDSCRNLEETAQKKSVGHTP